MELREVDCLEDFFTTQAMVDPDQIYHYMVTLGKTYLSRGQKDYDVDPYCQIVLCKITTESQTWKVDLWFQGASERDTWR